MGSERFTKLNEAAGSAYTAETTIGNPAEKAGGLVRAAASIVAAIHEDPTNSAAWLERAAELMRKAEAIPGLPAAVFCDLSRQEWAGRNYTE